MLEVEKEGKLHPVCIAYKAILLLSLQDPRCSVLFFTSSIPPALFCNMAKKNRLSFAGKNGNVECIKNYYIFTV